MNKTKPLSEAVKQTLIEQLENLEESYDSNFKESIKAMGDEISNFIKTSPLISEFKENANYWQCEYAKINKIKRIIQDIPAVEGPAYKVTAKTENETVYEATDKGGDNPPAV